MPEVFTYRLLHKYTLLVNSEVQRLRSEDFWIISELTALYEEIINLELLWNFVNREKRLNTWWKKVFFFFLLTSLSECKPLKAFFLNCSSFPVSYIGIYGEKSWEKEYRLIYMCAVVVILHFRSKLGIKNLKTSFPLLLIPRTDWCLLFVA